jgi:quercetin dioxygenase-like cupin family protein
MRAEAEGRIAVFEEVVPSGVGTPLHIHRTAEELIHILAGEFTVRLGEEFKQASGGAWIFVPRGLAHAWRNTGHEDGRAFFIFTPGDGAKAVEEMRFLGKPILEIEPAVRDEIWQRYGTEFITRDWM